MLNKKMLKCSPIFEVIKSSKDPHSIDLANFAEADYNRLYQEPQLESFSIFTIEQKNVFQ